MVFQLKLAKGEAENSFLHLWLKMNWTGKGQNTSTLEDNTSKCIFLSYPQLLSFLAPFFEKERQRKATFVFIKFVGSTKEHQGTRKIAPGKTQNNLDIKFKYSIKILIKFYFLKSDAQTAQKK